MDADQSLKAILSGVKAMVKNDGTKTNRERFWESLAENMGLTSEQVVKIEAACDSFYKNEFNVLKSIVRPNDISKRLVRALVSKGYQLVLATNPLFPLCAVESRLNWIGLEPADFLFITHYANSFFCKPNPGYYTEIFKQIGKAPQQCLMVGNNPAEDMIAGELGADTFLVTDYLENENDADITAFRRGVLTELEAWMASLPDITHTE